MSVNVYNQNEEEEERWGAQSVVDKEVNRKKWEQGFSQLSLSVEGEGRGEGGCTV